MNYETTKEHLKKLINDKIFIKKINERWDDLNRKRNALWEIQELIENHDNLQDKIDEISLNKDVAQEMYLLMLDDIND